MKHYILPILLQVIGILVIIAEIFIPSLGLLTAIALSVFFYSLYLVYTTISTTAGMVLAGLDIVLVPVLLIFGMKDGVVSQREDPKAYINMKGKSVTDLRPAGMAEINSQRVDVVTDGEYIDADTPIVVTEVSGNRIIVEQSE